MENRSRVCDIKKKFECLNSKNETQQSSKVVSNNRVNTCVTYAEPLKNHSNGHHAVSAKCLIKRSNAFRSDKPVLSGSRVTLPTDKPLNKNGNGPNNKECTSDVIEIEKNILHTNKGNEVVPSSNKVHYNNDLSLRVITPNKPKTTVEYAQVTPKSKLVASNRKIISFNKTTHPNSVCKKLFKNDSKEDLSESKLLKSPKSPVSDIISERITEVLKTPLPKGPPPKKPPRTFKHVVGQVIASNKELSNNSLKSKSKPEIKLTLSSDINVPFPLIKPLPPVRSKTEPQLTVKKFASALVYNQKNNVPVQVPNVRKSPNEQTPIVYDKSFKTDSLLCLGSLNCTSRDSFKKTNVYDVPFEPKSLFFIDLWQPNLASPNSAGIQNVYGLLKKPLSTDHIYSEPYSPRLNKKTKTGQAASVISKTLLNEQKYSPDAQMKPNKICNNTSVGEKKLYYMSSPIPEPPGVQLSPSTSQDSSLPGVSKMQQIDSLPGHEHEFLKVKSLLRKVYGELNTKTNSDSDTDSVASVTEDSVTQKESISPEQLTAKRKGYVQRMLSCRRLYSPVKQRAERLFDVLLLIGLNIDSKKIPYIKLQYPESATLPTMIEELCFPDASDWPPTEDYLHTNYTTVLTNESGERKYAYCRRIMPEGSEICVPLVYCLVTPHKCSGFYYKVLMEVENHHGLPQVNFKRFIQNLYDCKFPSSGEIINLPSDLSLKRPRDWREENDDLIRVIKIVTIPTFLKLFAALLLERKVILVGCNISKVSDCVEGLQTALFPFSWQHTLVTILPKSMLELFNAPTPYLIGIVKRPFEPMPFKNIDEALIVDLEKGNNIIQKVGDENSILPKKFYKCLRSALKMCLTTEENNLLASEVIMRFFIETTGHFRKHIISTENGKRHFEKELFIKGIECHNTQLFLEWFTETSMFEVFINSEIERSKIPGIFEERCVEFLEEATKNLHKKGRNVNKTVKTFW